MPRPALLIAETEPLQALSTRKLVLETAKYNVLTAHSREEALDIARDSPALSALIVLSDLYGADQVVAFVKKNKPSLPVISLSPNDSRALPGADYHLCSHEPQQLVELCRKLFGDPRTLK